MSNGKPDDGGGLLAKVVRMVRNPSSSWTESDPPASGSDSSYSKQMLKEMIERRRRNDFVRKREFDMLRKLRRNEIMAGNDPAARPSFFQSSLPSRPDDRASTLKKIDEIEAQMSQQWWKSREGSLSPSSGSTPFSEPAPIGAPDAAGSRPVLSRTRQGTLEEAAPAMPMLNFDFDASSAPAPGPGSRTAAPSLSQAPSAPPVAAAPLAHPIPLKGFYQDPDLEDPAIRFATGDTEGAELALLALVQPGGARHDDAETWLALFDFYRAAGQQQQFDEKALDFAARFARSAPQWVSFREAAQAGAQRTEATAAPANLTWSSPPSLGAQSLAALQALLPRSPAPWRLSWTRLSSIEDGALEPLLRLMAEWCRQTAELHFMDGAALEQVLRQRTVSGDKAVNPAWWRLRMEALRLLHRPDEFEIVALDYCVTYEVSPPSWERAQCRVRALLSDGSTEEGFSTLMQEDPFSASAFQGAPGVSVPGPSGGLPRGGTVRGELAGELLGDALPALRALELRLGPAEEIEICCSRLVRMDFTASGGLLNWVASRQAEGRQLHFTDVHRLVASFFGVVGIGAVARVTLRRD